MPDVIHLPWPPSVNNLFSQSRRTNRRFPSKQYKRWASEADACILARRVKPIKGRVRLEIDLTPRDRRPRDADNYNKAVIDCLVRNGVIEADDSSIVTQVTARWRQNAISGVVVTITPEPEEKRTRPPLGKHEAKVLAKIKGQGVHILRSNERGSAVMRRLVDKGYLRPLRGCSMSMARRRKDMRRPTDHRPRSCDVCNRPTPVPEPGWVILADRRLVCATCYVGGRHRHAAKTDQPPPRQGDLLAPG